MSNGAQPKFRIAIIGGGIAGLTLSLALQNSQTASIFDIDIFEAAPEFSEVGAGINIWPRTWEIFKSIGLDKSLANLLPHYPEHSPELVFEVRKSDQKEGIAVRDLIMNGGGLRFHRAELQRALLDHVSTSAHIHLSKRLKSYTEGTDIDLVFEDGFTTSCDLLIGADGIKSTVRRLFLTKQGTTEDLGSINPIWTGSVAYRGLVPVGDLERQFPGHRATMVPVMYCGKNKHLIVYPVSHGKYINVVAVHNSEPDLEGTFIDNTAVTSVPQAEMLAVFAGWEEEVQSLLRCIGSPTKWHLHALVPISRYAGGRIILMGDAAHAMTPHLGAGSGQAIEDAYVLAALIAKAANPADTYRIVEIYNVIRRPLGNQVLMDSRTQGLRSQLIAPGFEDVKEGDYVPMHKLLDLFEDMLRAWDWMWATSAEDDRKRAVDMM